ncbi:histidinol dehydrogenase [Planctomycetota bacterium]|nr:histidinol dehydrogenase [Planctomycetota bacterium]
MTDSFNIMEIGSDEFAAFQKRIAARSEFDDISLGDRPAELLQAAIDSGDKDFSEFSQKFYEGLAHTAGATVARVIDFVREQGDEAVRHLTRLFDGTELPTNRIRVNKLDLMKAADGADEETLALCREQVIPRIRAFHEKQKVDSWSVDELGGSVGIRMQPLERVGLYVPGSSAFYPSTLMMTAIPAQVAGVKEIAVFTPPNSLDESSLLAALLLELGIEEVYRVGGAQAVAAATFGTENIARVDRIVGPGNVFVSIAKQTLSHKVGIDQFAGPSEIVIVFDESADPAMVAADMLAQAEHDPEAAAVGITNSADHAEKVKAEFLKQIEDLPRREIADASIKRYGGILTAPSIGFALRLANSFAPEHCEIITEDADKHALEIRNAGAIFIGAYAPEAFGDYNAGANHVLPTCGQARWEGALSIADFTRQVSIIRGSEELLSANKDAAIRLARAERLEAHARSIEKRFS